MSKKENLSGSYDDGEVFILANDPKHSKRKQKMRNLDKKPIENTHELFSKKQWVLFYFIWFGLSMFAIWAFGEIMKSNPTPI